MDLIADDYERHTVPLRDDDLFRVLIQPATLVKRVRLDTYELPGVVHVFDVELEHPPRRNRRRDRRPVHERGPITGPRRLEFAALSALHARSTSVSQRIVGDAASRSSAVTSGQLNASASAT
jgi:hypothetical protein